ncbi:hypothetical protein AADZ90_017500 [Aestuariibius sp. 2305UL40-4]|uniref:hypothetical protein n=1 Tax=Aestuariibius violaceus TaxID=3234132 RepID=UPI0034879865
MDFLFSEGCYGEDLLADETEVPANPSIDVMFATDYNGPLSGVFTSQFGETARFDQTHRFLNELDPSSLDLGFAPLPGEVRAAYGELLPGGSFYEIPLRLTFELYEPGRAFSDEGQARRYSAEMLCRRPEAEMPCIVQCDGFELEAFARSRNVIYEIFYPDMRLRLEIKPSQDLGIEPFGCGVIRAAMSGVSETTTYMLPPLDDNACEDLRR